ncbi:MAG: hypothetical protein KDJ70_16740 [Candidatus Competibacteraceae bacterium]|nr:hypothetical protein [Candidatus Competibacteraceae bacterium]
MNVLTRIARPLRTCALMALLAPASGAAGPQQAEIHALVQELDYLIEYAERLAQKYAAADAPVRFNYPALLEQLRVTRMRSAAYLNEVQTVVHPAPPAPVAASLTERR